jgi:HD-GYP domain-containing protein (c-di-GMP phosphodiesterase class II)
MNRRFIESLTDERYWGAHKIAVIYLLIGSLWILFSDQIAAAISGDRATLTVISTLKGWGYILVTCLLLYWLIRRHTDALRSSEARLQARTDELQTLYESGLALSHLLTPHDIAQRIIDLMDRKLDWHHTTIRLYHPEDDSLELLAFHQPNVTSEAEHRAVEQRFKTLISRPGQGLSGWAFQHRQTVRLGDLTRDARYLQSAPGLRSGLYVPLKIGERTTGVISIETEQPDAFSEADERLTVTLATQAAIALENARLYAETLRQLEHLQALHAVDQAIATSLDLRVTLEVLLNHVVHQLGVDASDVLLFDPLSHTLECVRSHGFRTAIAHGTAVSMGSSFAGQAVLTRRIVQVHAADFRQQTPAFENLWLGEDFSAYYGVPLIAKGEVKGVLEVFLRTRHTPSSEWTSLLETLAGQAAISIDNTRLFESLQRANMELAIAYDATIEGWSLAMDLRDKETEGHTRRVTEMTIALAKALRLNDTEMIHIRRGALLHDIGKIGVPDNILLKAGDLNEAEWAILRRHPQFAHDMLHPIAYLRKAIDIPYCHHERWDGAGYPQGLAGEQIPLVARIFSVVDVWDALTTDRPYRKAWTRAAALDYILAQSGAQFDPSVVAAFLYNLKSQ